MARNEKKRSIQQRHDKTKLSVLEHQTWWERSLTRNARKQQKHDKTKLSILEHQRWWEKSSKRKETLDSTKTRQDEAQCTRTSNVVGEELNKKRSKTTKARQDEAQYTRTSNVVGEELKKEEE